MKTPENVLSDIQRSKVILTEMIANAREQGARNFEMLFTLTDGLDDLFSILTKGEDINKQFLENWNSVMGWAPRVFEDHPLLDLLRNIDNFLMRGRVL